MCLNRQIRFKNAFDVSTRDVDAFLSSSINVDIIKVVDFTNCYWISDSFLTSFIQQCVNLEVLLVAGTRLTCSDLAIIFKYCHKVTQLSLTIHTNDLWRNSLHLPWQQFIFHPLPGELFNLCVLQDVRQSIRKIRVLEISFTRPGELLTFLRWSIFFSFYFIMQFFIIFLLIYFFIVHVKSWKIWLFCGQMVHWNLDYPVQMALLYWLTKPLLEIFS